MSKKNRDDCFVIMPISDSDQHEKGHFMRVYRDIITPAVQEADYHPVRADEVKETNFIHLDLLQKLIAAPIVVCDLSTRNPNVLFELGIRQAFDKPVVLIQEIGTPKIFDISPIRYLEYSKEMKYQDVLKSQKELKEAILATKNAEGEGGNVNSILRLLALSSVATVPGPEVYNVDTLALELVQSHMSEMRRVVDMEMSWTKVGNISTIEYERISGKLDKLMALSDTPTNPRTKTLDELYTLMKDAEEAARHCDSSTDDRMFGYLLEQIDRFIKNLSIK